MARFLPSSGTSLLNIVAPDVSTKLSVIATGGPFEPGETFEIKGTLQRLDTYRGVPGATITVKYNGVNVGTRVTDSNGMYSISTSIPAAGSYTLTATFPGMTVAGLTFSDSRASIRTTIGVEAPSIISIAAMLGLAKVVYDIFLKK